MLLLFKKMNRLFNHVMGAYHARRAERHLRRDDLFRAVKSLDHCSSIGFRDFRTELLRGRVFLRLNRFRQARRAFSVARALDVKRYSSSGMPADLLLEMAETAYERNTATDPGPSHSPSDLTLSFSPCDDFSGEAERSLFRILPPIQPEDIENLDWAELERMLND